MGLSGLFSALPLPGKTEGFVQWPYGRRSWGRLCMSERASGVFPARLLACGRLMPRQSPRHGGAVKVLAGARIRDAWVGI